MSEQPNQQSCCNCRFSEESSSRKGVNFCRRHAPTIVGTSAGAVQMWPSVHDDYWCGDFEPRKKVSNQGSIEGFVKAICGRRA